MFVLEKVEMQSNSQKHMGKDTLRHNVSVCRVKETAQKNLCRFIRSEVLHGIFEESQIVILLFYFT